MTNVRRVRASGGQELGRLRAGRGVQGGMKEWEFEETDNGNRKDGSKIGKGRLLALAHSLHTRWCLVWWRSLSRGDREEKGSRSSQGCRVAARGSRQSTVAIRGSVQIEQRAAGRRVLRRDGGCEGEGSGNTTEGERRRGSKALRDREGQRWGTVELCGGSRE